MTMTREEAFNDIDNVREVLRHNGLDLAYDVLTIAEQRLKEEHKTGKWKIYVISMLDGEGCRCSECGFEGTPYWEYCPHCGAKMEGAEK